MFLLKFVIFLLLLFLVSYLFEKILRKIANVKKRKGFIYKPLNERHKRWQRIIVVIYIIGLMIHGFSSSEIDIYVLNIIFLTVLYLHRAFMEWKYDKDAREYIITFSGTVYMVLLMYSFVKFDLFDKLF